MQLPSNSCPCFYSWYPLSFPGGSDGTESTCSAGDQSSILGLGWYPGEGNGYPLHFLPGEIHGQRSLVSYSPWDQKESDTTEQLTLTMTQQSHYWTCILRVCVCAQPCPTLYDPMDCSPPGSSVLGIVQARILEWVAISSSRGSSWPRSQIHISSISYTGRQIFTTEPPGKPLWRNNISNLKTFSGFLWLSCWSLHSLICTQRSS